jgi:Holliday junction resolvase
MASHYRSGYNLEKRVVNRLNESGDWFAQRAPSSKGVDVVATSRKHYKTVFLECKNTQQETYSIEREQVLELTKKGLVAGAEVYVAICWRGRTEEGDARRKLMRFYPIQLLAAKFDESDAKTAAFKPYDYSMSFEEVFFP